MLTLTQTMQKMQERTFSNPMKIGKKRKEQDNPQSASTSKTTKQNSESEIKSQCLSLAEKCGEPIYEKFSESRRYEKKAHYGMKYQRKKKYCRSKDGTCLVMA